MGIQPANAASVNRPQQQVANCNTRESGQEKGHPRCVQEKFNALARALKVWRSTGRAAPGSDSEYRFGDDPAEEQPLSARSKPHPNCTFANINAEVAKAEDRGFTNVPTFVGSKLSVNTFDHAGLTHAGEDTSMLQPEPTTSLEAFGAIRTEISPHGQRTKTIAAEPPSQRPAKRDRLYGAKWRSSGGEACSIPIFDGFGDLRNSSDLLVQLDDIEFPALSSLLLQQKPKPKKVSLLGGTARHASPSATDWGIGPAALTDRPAKSAALTRVFRRTSGRSSMGSNTSASTNSTFDSVDLDGIERADAVHVPRPRASGAMRKPAVRSRGASAFPTPAPSSPGRSSVAPLPATKILPPPFDPDAFAPRRSTHAERSYNVAVKHLEERLNVSAYNCTARPEVDFVLPAWLAGKHGSRTSAEAKIKKILGAVGNQAMSKTNGVEKKGKATSRKKKDMAEDRMEVDEVWPALVPMKSGQTPKVRCPISASCDILTTVHSLCAQHRRSNVIRAKAGITSPASGSRTTQLSERTKSSSVLAALLPRSSRNDISTACAPTASTVMFRSRMTNTLSTGLWVAVPFEAGLTLSILLNGLSESDFSLWYHFHCWF